MKLKIYMTYKENKVSTSGYQMITSKLKKILLPNYTVNKTVCNIVKSSKTFKNIHN